MQPEPPPQAPYTSLPDFSANLVLVVGVGRSGTTALHQALGYHPDLIDAPSEAPLERSIAVAHGTMIDRPAKFVTYVKRQTKVPWTHVQLSRRNMIFEAAFGTPAGAPILDRRAADRGDVDDATRWVAKVGGISRKGLLGFNDVFEDFRTVYIHRSGIDAVASRTKFYGFSDKSFAENCETWARTALDMDTVTNNSRATVVKHSDLLRHPEDLFDAVLAGLDLGPSAAPAAHARESITHPTQDADGQQSVRDHFDARAPAHETWTDEEKRTFVEICGPSMERLGYDIPFG